MKKIVVVAVVFAAAVGSLAAFETTKSLNLPAQGVRRLEIQAGAGSLTVTGREGLAAIEVQAEIVARHVRDEDMDGFLKDRIELVLEMRGDVAVLVSRVRERFRLFSFDDGAVINLTVFVPKTMPLEIDDGSGSIAVEDLAAVRIDDGSGSIRVDRIAGQVEINDGSGGIRIRRVGGTVTVDDGSGSIDIADVEKDVRLVRTGSGGVDISNVKGQVTRSR